MGEKLAGIGVIALSLALVCFILWPVVFAAPSVDGHGKATCLTTLKQLALSGIMYAGDYDDRLPLRDEWMDAFRPYHKNILIEHCPGVQSSNADPNKPPYGYAFDSRLSLQVLAKVNEPRAQTFLYDSINLARNASDPLLSLPDPLREHPAKGGSTKRYNSMAYLDGHVTELSAEEP